MEIENISSYFNTFSDLWFRDKKHLTKYKEHNK